MALMDAYAFRRGVREAVEEVDNAVELVTQGLLAGAAFGEEVDVDSVVGDDGKADSFVAIWTAKGCSLHWFSPWCLD